MLKPNLGGKLTLYITMSGQNYPGLIINYHPGNETAPKIIGLVSRFFKLYRADPNENQQARMPRFPSVHTQLLN